MIVAGVLCLVDREQSNGRANIEAALGGAKFYAAFTAKDVRAAHVAQPIK